MPERVMTTLLPVRNDDMILQRPALGFQPLKPQFGLSELADMLDMPVSSQQHSGAVIVNAGETAIPDICAHIQYLRSKLQGDYIDLTDEAVKAWVGIMAIIVVSELRDNFKLNVERICLNGSKTEYMKNIYREALEKEGLLDEDQCVRVLNMNGNPIAILDVAEGTKGSKARCFCYPFSTIDNPSDSMYPVKWFHPGELDKKTNKRIAHRWKNVLGKDPRTNLPYLTKEEKGMFVLWLDSLKKHPNGLISYHKAVNAIIRELKTDIADASSALITVETTFTNPARRPQNLTAWRGVLACIALSNMRGCKIEVELYRPRSIDDPLRSVMLCGQTSLMMLKVNGARVGLLDKNLLVRPFYHITDELTHIPWYQNGEWVEISGNMISMEEMDKAERRKLAWWYSDMAVRVSDANTAKALNDSCKLIVDAFGAKLSSNCNAIEGLDAKVFKDGTPIPDQFIAIMQSIKNAPDYTNVMPPEREMFTERLILTMAGPYNVESQLGIVNNKIENVVLITDDSDPFNPKTERFLALLPLRSSFTKTFSEREDGLNLDTLRISIEGSVITVYITLYNDGATATRQWSYSVDDGEVLYYDQFPYISMWPYVRSDSWKQYFVSWCHNLISFTESSIFPPTVEQLLPVPEFENITTLDNDAEKQWRLLTYQTFPEFIHFKIQDGGIPIEVGSIYVTPPQYHNTAEKTCYAAIDFGSSNTIVRLTDENGQIINDNTSANEPYCIFNNEYVKPLTMCANELPEFYMDVRNFHEFMWLPYFGSASDGARFWIPDATQRTDRLPTVVQLYNGASLTNNKAPRFGQFLRSNCGVMTYFLGEESGKNTPIEKIGIRSNIKMMDSPDLYVGQIAIQMILLNCALAAVEHDAKLSFIVSYPDDRMWGKLNKFWKPAASNAQQICSGINFRNNVELRTTELWAAKYFASKFVQNANPKAGYCIIDIGGGTTDISLWKNDGRLGSEEKMVGGLSLKYAGNQITAESIFSFYRRIAGASDGNINDFRMLWDLKEASPAINNYEKEMEKGFDNLVGLQFSVANNVNMVHNKVPLLATTIVSDCEFSEAVMLDFDRVQPFKALLRLKMSNVFYVLSWFICLLGAFDYEETRTSYQVCLAGNGAKALDACGEGMNEYLVDMMKTVIMDRRFEIENLPTYRKTEVVNGMCKMLEEKLASSSLTRESLMQPKDVNQLDYDDIAMEELVDKMWESYNQYVEYLIRPNKEFFAIDGSKSIYDMLTMFENFEEDDSVTIPSQEILFANNYERILNQVLNESGSGTPNIMVAHIAAIKLIDYILLIHKYK